MLYSRWSGGEESHTNELPNRSEFLELFEPLSDKPFTVRHRETGIEVDILTRENPVLNPAILALVPEMVDVIEQAGIQVRVAQPQLIAGLKIARAINNTPAGLQDRADILALMRDNPEMELQGVRAHLSDDENALLDDLQRYREQLAD